MKGIALRHQIAVLECRGTRRYGGQCQDSKLADGRSRSNLVQRGRFLVFAPHSPVGFGLALSCAPARSFFRLLLFEALRSHAAPGDGRSRPRAPLCHFQPGLLAGLLRQAAVAANSVAGVRA
jgi:hypothetical protein